MTTKEAIQAMLDGKKVIPSGWSDGLYITFNGTHFIREDEKQFLFGSLEYKWELYEEHKPKQVVVIEKWLCYDNLSKSYSIAEESNIDGYINDDRAYISKVKLLDTYEVELDDKK